MPVCGSCSADLPNGAKFCSHCGESVAVHNVTADLDPRLAATHHLPEETPEAPPPASSGTGSILDSIHESPIQPPPPPASGGSSLSESATSSHGRFVPGTVLDERYRIVGLLGQGGMGEVYRADDLKLGQSVALKFLPEALADDRQRLDLLHNEVRLARQVSHPNVCRVYDIGEIDGMHFLSMEFIDGEDLSGLMRRIGRLPPDKGIDIARQLCSGLYAAHEKGVLHRDLKPANIMLDGRGQVRITDFGLARLTDVEDDSGNRVGTPAYMAPEQLAGGAVTVQSDMYSLGLVLHEVFTGQPMYRAASIAELVKLREESSPSTLSSVVPDIDPAVERVILRCLEKEPTRRPGSVVQIAAALPGGDPLAAALAAGETPSPELVAASGENTGFSVKHGVMCLAALAALVTAAVLLADRMSFFVHSNLTQKPDVLEAKAREIAMELVGPDVDLPVRDSAFGYDFNADNLTQDHKTLHATGDGMLEFWYRQSPAHLNPQHPFIYARSPRKVTLADPVPSETGMVGVRLSASGLLREISLITPLTDAPPHDAQPGDARDWERPFQLAGLKLADYEPSEPQWTPPTYGNKRFAWVLKRKGDSISGAGPPRVEAATFNGRVSYFQVIHSWTTRQWTVPARKQNQLGAAAKTENSVQFANAFFFLIGGPMLAFSVFLALHNLRMGNADKKGALRFVFAMAIFDMATSFLEAHHNLSISMEMTNLLSCLVNAIGRVIRFWIYYVALEPYVRRIWPRVLVGWSRLVDGRVVDPVVGRDVLIGCVIGAALASVMETRVLTDGLRQQGVVGQQLWQTDALLGGRGIALTLSTILVNMMTSLYSLLILVVFRIFFRRDWLTVLLFVGVWVKMNTSASDGWPTYACVAVVQTVNALLVLRFGLLTFMASSLVQHILLKFPITSHLSEWYAGSGLVGVAFILVLALAAFYTSLGQKSLLSDPTDSPPSRLGGSPLL